MHQRRFTSEDQIAFAELSGDNNPLHMDPIAARRYIFGQPVVHGIHSVLWALDEWQEGQVAAANLRSIKAYFFKPIVLGSQVQYSAIPEQAQRLRIELLSSGSVSTRIIVEWDMSQPKSFACLETRFPEQRPPRVLSEDEINGHSGILKLCLDIEAGAKLFPHLIRCVSPMQIAVILGTTRLVGVECPGLHSLYYELDLSADDSHECAGLNYEVTKLDKGLHLAFIKVIAPGMTGSIQAFVRPAPQHQSSYLHLKGLVERNEFGGQRALVIGGSRGLGEVVAKLLCAGGAKVKITYYQGKEDARRVVDEIVSNGDACQFSYLDVLNPESVPDTSQSDWNPTHLYYFATPFIFSAVMGKFSADLFNRFCDYYVIGFIKTVDQLRLGLKNVFYPSTVAIDELPLNMGEYAAAKMAGEAVCAFLEKKHPGMKIHRPRLPRMSTDQTVSLMPVHNLDPVPAMIKALRSFRDSSILKEERSLLKRAVYFVSHRKWKSSSSS